MSTEQHFHGVSIYYNRVPVAEEAPEEAKGIGDSKKNDRDGITLTTVKS